MNLDDIPEHWDVSFTHVNQFNVKHIGAKLTWICRIWDLTKWEGSYEEKFLFYGKGILPSLAFENAVTCLEEYEIKRKRGFKSGGVGLHIFLEEVK